MDRSRLLDASEAMVALVDVQKNHFHTTFDPQATLGRMVRFLGAARILEVPVVWTEHHPRAFGPTLPPVAEALAGLVPIPKTSFGCFGEPVFAEAVRATGRSVLYLAGSETHICIGQTALGALERGMDVVVVADCVNARARMDHDTALGRLERAGAEVATWETVVYEWMRDAHHPRFRQVLALVKG
ncbi:MAG: isochorismatase family protein [Deltaproteobacteria bacterium]|nr:isochorismatase family protein [Deltaproteobacteria bacterium]